MELYVHKINTRRKALRAILSDADGAINLSSAEKVELILRNRRLGTVALTGACTVENATSGIVRYDWSEADLSGILASPASYDAEFKVTWATNDTQRVPSDGFFAVQIIRNAEAG